MNLVDDVNLPFAARGRVAYATDDFFTYVFDARTACCVELVHIGVCALGDSLTFFTRTIGLNSGAVLTQQGLGQNSSRSGFARTARTAEQVGVRHLVLLDGVFQRALNMFLPNDIGKRCWAIFAIQSFHTLSLLIKGRANPGLENGEAPMTMRVVLPE